MIGGTTAGIVVALVLFDRLIVWAETHGKRSYDDPNYVAGSYNPLFELFDPALKRQREIVAEKEVAGDDAEADGAPPEPGPPPVPSGPTAFLVRAQPGRSAADTGSLSTGQPTAEATRFSALMR